MIIVGISRNAEEKANLKTKAFEPRNDNDIVAKSQPTPRIAPVSISAADAAWLSLGGIARMRHSIMLLFAVFVSLAGGSGGCSADQSRNEAKREFIREGDRLFIPYMTGDLEQARQGLKQTISHYEESSVLDSKTRAEFLELDYDRLYVLEKRCGNQNAADIALIKARYWRTRSLELNGVTGAEEVATESLDTPEKRMKRVDDFDKGDGKTGPKYLQYIEGTKSESR